MASLLSQFLVGGGNLTPADINPSNNDDIDSSLRRWLARGRRIPFGMDETQFREYVRRLRARPGQQNAILAEMGLTGEGRNPPPLQPTARTVRTLPIGSDGQPPPETGGGPGAATALSDFGNLFNQPPPTVTADVPDVTPPPPTVSPPSPDATRNPWAPTVHREPPPDNTPNYLGNALANAIPEIDPRVNPISQGLLAGLGPPTPPPQTGWISNPFQQRNPRMTRYTGMFG